MEDIELPTNLESLDNTVAGCDYVKIFQDDVYRTDNIRWLSDPAINRYLGLLPVLAHLVADSGFATTIMNQRHEQLENEFQIVNKH